MLGLLIRWALNAGALLLIANFVPGIQVTNFWHALIAAAALGLVNVILGTILRIITLPLTIITFGLFSIVVNAIIFWVTGYIIEGFDVTTLMGAVIGSVLMTIASWITARIVGKD